MAPGEAQATCGSQLRGRAAVALSCPIGAGLSVSPNPAVPGTTVTLDASASTGTDGGAITGYAFDFGSGTFGPATTSATATHVFSSRGSYPVRVQVSDATGATATASATVYASAAPQASFTAAPNPVSLNQTVSFDASASSETAPGQIVKYELPRPRFTGHCGEQSDHATVACASASRRSRASAGVR